MREPVISTVTKGKMVIPKNIQTQLGIKPGDRIRYSVRGNKLEIEKLSGTENFDPFFSFTEWSSPADEKAFGHLKPKGN